MREKAKTVAVMAQNQENSCSSSSEDSKSSGAESPLVPKGRGDGLAGGKVKKTKRVSLSFPWLVPSLS